MVHKRKKVYAKKVFDYIRGIWIEDRTKLKHRAKFDVDFFGRGQWNYDSSSNDLEKAKSFAKKVVAKTPAKFSRVVNSETGEVVFSVEK